MSKKYCCNCKYYEKDKVYEAGFCLPPAKNYCHYEVECENPITGKYLKKIGNIEYKQNYCTGITNISFPNELYECKYYEAKNMEKNR